MSGSPSNLYFENFLSLNMENFFFELTIYCRGAVKAQLLIDIFSGRSIPIPPLPSSKTVNFNQHQHYFINFFYHVELAAPLLLGE